MDEAYAALVHKGVQPSEIPRLTLRQIDLILNPPQGDIVSIRDEAAIADYLAARQI